MGWQDNVWIGLSADHISPVLWERIYSLDGANAVGSSAEGGNVWWRSLLRDGAGCARNLV